MTTPVHLMTLDELGTELKRVTGEMSALTAHEQLTRAQEKRFDELQDECRQLELRQITLFARGEGGGRVFPGTPHDDEDRDSRPRNQTRDAALRVIDSAARSGSLPDHAAERATALVDSGRANERSIAARWVATTGDPAYLSAFTKLLADPVRGHMLWEGREQEAYQAVATLQTEMRGMSLTDANGGYMVPLTLDPAIILTSSGSINPLRRISRVVQTVTDQWQGVSSAGVTAEWKAEAAEAADASPTLANPSIPVHFGDAFVPYSFEVGMDAMNFAQELQKLLVDAADQLQATAYTTGTGSGQPTGIITALTGTSSEVNAAADDTFARGDVYTIQNALPPRFQPNAQWCANLSIINTMSQFETTAGARLFPEIADGRLLNRPLNELSNMDGSITTSGAVSNFVLLYGDFRNFVIADRIGTTLELIPNLVGANRRPTGQRGAMLWFRTGSDSVNDAAFRMLDVASAA
jgi:HK97 family phage major capsid protein